MFKMFSKHEPVSIFTICPPPPSLPPEERLLRLRNRQKATSAGGRENYKNPFFVCHRTINLLKFIPWIFTPNFTTARGAIFFRLPKMQYNCQFNVAGFLLLCNKIFFQNIVCIWIGTKYIYSNTVFKYNSEVFVLFLLNTFICPDKKQPQRIQRNILLSS